jgi:hypothetical protein
MHFTFGAKFLNFLVLCDKINRFLTFPCVRPIGSAFCLYVQTYTHLIPFIHGACPLSSSSVRIAVLSRTHGLNTTLVCRVIKDTWTEHNTGVPHQFFIGVYIQNISTG